MILDDWTTDAKGSDESDRKHGHLLSLPHLQFPKKKDCLQIGFIGAGTGTGIIHESKCWLPILTCRKMSESYVLSSSPK